jgi:hypothetical protein
MMFWYLNTVQYYQVQSSVLETSNGSHASNLVSGREDDPPSSQTAPFSSGCLNQSNPIAHFRCDQDYDLKMMI